MDSCVCTQRILHQVTVVSTVESHGFSAVNFVNSFWRDHQQYFIVEIIENTGSQIAGSTTHSQQFASDRQSFNLYFYQWKSKNQNINRKHGLKNPKKFLEFLNNGQLYTVHFTLYLNCSLRKFSCILYCTSISKLLTIPLHFQTDSDDNDGLRKMSHVHRI